MDEFESTDDGGSTLDFISSLASNATQAYDTTAALNANPLNTALVYGGTATTAQGMVAGAINPTPTATGSSLLLFGLAAAIIVFFVVRK